MGTAGAWSGGIVVWIAADIRRDVGNGRGDGA